MVFNVFGSRDLPRDPQETQEPPKKHPKTSKERKKSTKNIKISASVVKNALSWRSHFKRFLSSKKAQKVAHFLNDFYTIC